MQPLKLALGILKRWWLILFGILCLGLIIKYLDELAIHVRNPINFSAPYLLLPLLFQFLFWLSLTVIWRKVVLIISNIRLTILISFSHIALVSIGKYMPGKIWGMVARGGQMRGYGISAGNVAKATYLEQLFLLHAGIVVSGLLVAGLFRSQIGLLLGFLAILSVLIGVLFHDRVLNRSVSLFNRFFNNQKNRNFISIPTLSYLRFLLTYIIIWLISGLVFVGLFLTFISQEISPELILALLLANTAGISAGFFAIFAPGGIGVREAVSIAILIPFMSLDNAVTLSLFSRLWLVAMDFFSGGIALYLLRKNISPAKPAA